jgi:hypothetical protein
MKPWILTWGIVFLSGCDAILPQVPNPQDCVSNPQYCASAGESLVCDTLLHACVRPDAECVSPVNCPSPMDVVCATQRCAPCTADQQCVDWNTARKQNQSLIYCINGTCAGCRNNADCSTTGSPVCDSNTHSCRGCSTGAECAAKSAATPYCNVTGGNCSTCMTDGNCTDAMHPLCDQSLGTCVGCRTSADCPDPNKPICSPSSTTDIGHTCRPCTSNAECAARMSCAVICYNGGCID